MEKVKIGIIGAGNMGTTHIKNIMDNKVPELQTASREEETGAKNICRKQYRFLRMARTL